MVSHFVEQITDSPCGTNSTHPRICFDLPESLAHITHLRKTSRCYVLCLGLCEEDANDLETMLGELTTNVVRHAKAKDGLYHVSIELWSDRYVLHVIDKGVGFSVDDAPPPCTPRPDTLSPTLEERIGGMGLLMVRALADQVDIGPTDPNGNIPGTTVRAEKRLRNA